MAWELESSQFVASKFQFFVLFFHLLQSSAKLHNFIRFLSPLSVPFAILNFSVGQLPFHLNIFVGLLPAFLYVVMPVMGLYVHQRPYRYSYKGEKRVQKLFCQRRRVKYDLMVLACHSKVAKSTFHKAGAIFPFLLRF